MTESLCSTMNVRNSKPWDTKHGVTQYCWHVFCFLFLCKFDVCMIWKKPCIVYLYTQTSQSIVFVRSNKFCDESGLAILSISPWTPSMLKYVNTKRQAKSLLSGDAMTLSKENFNHHIVWLVSAYKFTLIDYNCILLLLSNYLTDLFQKNPVPKVPAKVEVGLVFKVKKSALNINPFVEADTTPCIKERRLCIMGNNPDLLNISRHFQTRKHPSNRNLMTKY